MSARSRAMIVAVALASGRAEAQPDVEPGDAKPWAVGVSEQDRVTALELYKRGNVEFQEAHFEPALELYRQAIQHWDHPAIRYNMAVAYNTVGQLLEADDNLERSLRFGEAPLGHDIYTQGLSYRRNFESRLAHLKIACKEPETQVSLDGHALFTGPGEMDKLVLPGDHQVVASKPGFLTASETLVLAAGVPRTYDVRLVALEAEAHLVRRWTPWRPWAIAAAGVVGVGLGGLAYVLASHDAAAFDSGVAARCPHGCDGAMLVAFPDLTDDRDRSALERDAEVVLLTVGGAALVTGLVGVVLNVPHAVTEHLVATPTRNGATFGAGWRF